MNNHGRSAFAVIEFLEARQLLSAVQCFASDDGTLIVSGSAGKDVISVSVAGDTSSQTANVTVKVGTGKSAVEQVFRGVMSLNINGNDGNDVIKLSGTGLSDFWFYTSVFGDTGNDRIVISKFDGNVTVSGGDGNDIIDASHAFAKNVILGQQNSHRWLYGDAGNDRITGSNVDDGLYGGEGNDTLTGGAGNDDFNGGRGKNRINCGDGNDSVYVNSLEGAYGTPDEWSAGGRDVIRGGRGNDTVFRAFNSSFGAWSFGDRRFSIENVVLNDYAWYGEGKG